MGKAEAAKKQYAGVKCCDKERERESRPWLVCDSSNWNRRTCHQVCQLRFRHRQGTRFHVPIYLIYIYAFSYMKREMRRSSSLNKIEKDTTTRSLKRNKALQKHLSIRSVQKHQLNIRTPPMRSKTTLMSGLCPKKKKDRWIDPTSPARSSTLLPNQLGVLA